MKILKLLKYDRRSFSSKVFYLFTLIMFTLHFAFTTFYIYSERGHMREQLINDGIRLAGLLAYNSRLGVFAENDRLLNDPVESTMQYEEAVVVQVFTVDGKHIVTADRGGKKTISSLQGEELETLKRSAEPFYSESDDYFEFWASILSKGGRSQDDTIFFGEGRSVDESNKIGFVRIEFTKRILNQSLQEMLYFSLIMSVLIIIPGWIILYLIVRGITRPIKMLTEGVKAMETGEEVQDISVVSDDEIGRLAEAFNNMTRSLKRREIEKDHLEKRLRHSQKMEAIGTFTGGIAHDFNNILNAISTFGYVMKNELKKEDLSAKQFLDKIISATKRGAALTKSLLAFSRKEALNPKPVSLNNIIKNSETILERLIGEDIELKVDLAEEDITVMADADHMDMVLMNLATNARDSMDEGGELSITTESVDIGSRLSVSTGLIKPGRYAVVSVSDTGAGIDSDTKDKIFDPFFTTKTVGKGTGLGLSVVYGIIKQHAGNINVESDPDKGTTFKIYLPITVMDVVEKKSESISKPADGTETLLLAEDDENVRNSTASILKQYGYRVIEAVDGADAVKKFMEQKDNVDLLLFDLIMPEMDGKEAYEEISKISPGIKILFVSGYSADILNAKGCFDKDLNLLYKPFIPDDLLFKIRDILDSE